MDTVSQPSSWCSLSRVTKDTRKHSGVLKRGENGSKCLGRLCLLIWRSRHPAAEGPHLGDQHWHLTGQKPYTFHMVRSRCLPYTLYSYTEECEPGEILSYFTGPPCSLPPTLFSSDKKRNSTDMRVCAHTPPHTLICGCSVSSQA